jgi:CheY-like chemotaxis protein
MEHSGLNRLQVLVVDDNHHMINILKTILRGFGVKEVLEARDAAEAFSILGSTPIDFLICDYAMSPLNGIEFVRLVRTASDSPAPLVPIIMLTAYSERSNVEAARDAGASEFCVKPVTAVELYKKVTAIVNLPRSFVRSQAFIGPDRRRRTAEFGPENRRSADAAPEDT